MSIFSVIGGSLRALFKNRYRCMKCGYTVDPDRPLQESQRHCPLCGGHLFYQGAGK